MVSQLAEPSLSGRVQDAENGIEGVHHNGRPSTSDYIERVTKDVPKEMKERLMMMVVYPQNGD